MKKDSVWIKLFILTVIVFGAFINMKALATTTANIKKSPNHILKIFYFKDNPKARTSLFKYPSSIDVLAPQAYSIDSSGILTGVIDPGILSFTKKHKIKIMPLVTNKSFSKNTAETILDDQSKQDLALNALITEAKQQGYWGWQIDFEQMDASYKDKYSAFINRASALMKEYNLVFSVAVIAQISSNPADYPRDLWDRIIGVYDYGSLAASADFISVMSYDDPESTGPVAPYLWLKQVIDYSLKFIPRDKLSLGIPLYYWKWNNKSGKVVGIGGYAGIKNILKRRHITLGYNTTNQAPFIKYAVNKIPYTLWYENTKSVAKKINLIKQDKLQGFSAWLLGLEDPKMFSVLK